MNKKVVDKLWLVANKARGIFEDTGLCKMMILMLFLKYIDMKKDEEDEMILPVYDDKYSLGYLALTYGKMVGMVDLAQYVERIEHELGLENTCISIELGRLLEKADAETVKTIADVISQADFESTNQMYELALMLLNRLIYANGKTGEYLTNLSLSRLEARLLDCKDGMMVYDGFCGSGISASEVAGNKGIIHIQDLNVGAVAIASIMNLLKGNQIGDIRCGDSILNPLSNGKYDRIVCEPPFGGMYDREYLLSVPKDNCMYHESLDRDSLALRHCLAQLKDDGIAAVLVPMGMLFKSGRGAEVREKLIKKHIDMVIELPGGVFYPYTAIATALLILKNNKQDNSIYMINARDFFERNKPRGQAEISEENINRIVKMYQNKEEIDGIAKNTPIDEIAANGFNLCTTQYVTLSPEDTITIEDTTVYVQKYDQLVGQLAEIDKQLGAVRSRFTKEA